MHGRAMRAAAIAIGGMLATLVVAPAASGAIDVTRSADGVLRVTGSDQVEQVVVQPEFRRVVDVPPTYRRVARRVLVDEGESGWRRVHIPRHCRY